MYKIILIIVSILFGISNLSCQSNRDNQIHIEWVNDLKGDFDFRTKWSYPEGIYRNQFGQLTCDGMCPEEIKSMMDNDGKINSDSLVRFYQLVDTTHQYHTISCEAWCYEWAGTDFIKAKQTNKNQIVCSPVMNSGTHCSLIIDIKDDICVPRIELMSIAAPGLKNYYCKGGFIRIDKNSWIKGIIKAQFTFDFNNTDDPEQEMFWKGKIYTTIEE